MFRRPLLRSASLSALVAVGFLVMIAEPATAGANAVSTTAVAKASDSTANPDCRSFASLDRDDFPSRQKVDNTWFPLVPGTNFVMSGTVIGDDGQPHAHRIVTTVTDLTKMINGIRSIVVFDRDFDDGELVESELALMAQDDDGTVWNVGEYPEEYEQGTLIGAPKTWIAGIAGAKAGVGMLAKPSVSAPAYLQGLSRSIDFKDCAKVVKTGQRVCVAVGCYSNVLVIDEWAPLDPEGGHQLKYYAPRVGTIRVDAVGGTTPEVLQLTSLTTLGPRALTKIRTQALTQDRRGYLISPKVYGKTPPMR
jgi:hypothetical protein